jgi:hypothetical protein
MRHFVFYAGIVGLRDVKIDLRSDIGLRNVKIGLSDVEICQNPELVVLPVSASSSFVLSIYGFRSLQ